VGGAPAAPPLPYSPTVDALERLWDEVSGKPLWAPPNLWRYVALRRRATLRLLDPNQVVVAAPGGKINDCSACTDTCCVGPRSTVLLRLRDIATLIDLGRTDLMTQTKPRFTEAELRERPALRRQVRSEAWSVFPSLAQDSMHACRALTADGRCSLYPSWPLSCARFPYALRAEARQVFYSQRCDAFWIRPDTGEAVRQMAVAAVTAYNERIKDLVLLAYAPRRLTALGLMEWLWVDEPGSETTPSAGDAR
jgi:Fe-S-cluster containining protein